MGITSRQRRPLNRTMPHFRDTRLIIIATEGAKTEKQYFEAPLFQHRRVQVRVLPTNADGHSSPQHVLHRLRDFAMQTELQPDDQLWLVVDKDRWPDHLLASVCSNTLRGRKITIQPAVSNPCFELWLYLHHDDWADGPVRPATRMKAALRELLGEYNSSNLKMDAFQPGIDAAIRRAKALDSPNKCHWPENPGTRVYRIVEAILNLQEGL